MAALNVDQYKNQVKRVIDRWATRMADCTKQLARINEGIVELKKKLDCATPEGEKKFKAELEKLEQAREKVLTNIKSVNMSLRVELMLIEPPEATKANEGELKKLPGFIGKLVEDGGVELGKSGVVLKPDVEFDFKGGKLKKFGVELKLKW